MARKLYAMLALSLCHDLGHALKKKKNIFFDVDIVVKNKLSVVLAWYVLLYTMVCIITVVKICCGLKRCSRVSPQQIGRHFNHCDDACCI